MVTTQNITSPLLPHRPRLEVHRVNSQNLTSFHICHSWKSTPSPYNRVMSSSELNCQNRGRAESVSYPTQVQMMTLIKQLP